MIKTVTEVINGNEYLITTFDAIKGNLILFKLIKYLRGGTSLFDGVQKGLQKGGSLLDTDLSDLSISEALQSILANLDPEEINAFFIMMLQNVTFDNKILTSEFIKSHFAGNYLEMYTLLFAIVKANYFNEGTKNFFVQARQKLNPLAEPKQAKSTKDTVNN